MSRFFSFFLLILQIEAKISTLFSKKDSYSAGNCSYPVPANVRQTPGESYVIKKKRKKHI